MMQIAMKVANDAVRIIDGDGTDVRERLDFDGATGARVSMGVESGRGWPELTL